MTGRSHGNELGSRKSSASNASFDHNVFMSYGPVVSASQETLLMGEKRAELDGFEDFKIYIKLLKTELKILMVPIYLALLRSQEEINQSNLGAGGQSNLMSSHLSSLESSQNFSPHHSVFM